MFINLETDQTRCTAIIPLFTYKITNDGVKRAEQMTEAPRGARWWDPITTPAKYTHMGGCVGIDCTIEHLFPASPGIPVPTAAAMIEWVFGTYEQLPLGGLDTMQVRCLGFIKRWLTV